MYLHVNTLFIKDKNLFYILRVYLCVYIIHLYIFENYVCTNRLNSLKLIKNWIELCEMFVTSRSSFQYFPWAVLLLESWPDFNLVTHANMDLYLKYSIWNCFNTFSPNTDLLYTVCSQHTPMWGTTYEQDFLYILKCYYWELNLDSRYQ